MRNNEKGIVLKSTIIYTQATNRHHKRSGHLFQGRYKAILVDKEQYLLELARYVVLNPVRAKGMVRKLRIGNGVVTWLL